MNPIQPSSISKRLGRYREKGMVYVSLGSSTKREVERLSSLDGMNVSDFIRGLVQREIGRREVIRVGIISQSEEED